jgi:hypothetical protein
LTRRAAEVNPSDDDDPGRMSATIVVPAFVPSDRQSSSP